MLYETFNSIRESLIIIKEIIFMSVAIATVVIAYFGLRTWNAQLKGTTKYKIAKDVLTKTFKLRDEFSVTRNPLITAAEMSHVNNNESELESRNILSSIDKLSFKAHLKRLQNLNDVKQELEITKLEADAVFGKKETEEIKKLIEKVYQMNKEFNFMYEMKHTEDWGKEEKELLNTARRILYSFAAAGEDNFGKKIMDLVNGIEEKFRKYLK